MKLALVLPPRVRQDIRIRTDKILRELGNPEPPLSLGNVRDLLRLDRGYFTSEKDGLLQTIASKLRRGGKQLLRRPTLLFEVIKKFDLRAVYLPDRKFILIDESLPKPKHRWLEAHEVGHDILPWHGEMMLGDDELTPTANTQSKMEAEANYAGGALLFLGDRFREECKQVQPSIANAKLLKKRYGNTLTTTFWRMIEYAGEERSLVGAIGHHPFSVSGEAAFRHIIPSADFKNRFETPSADQLLHGIRSYCHRGQRGPLGSGEVQISDRNGTAHLFDFETFSNSYDALTLGVHRGPVNTTVSCCRVDA